MFLSITCVVCLVVFLFKQKTAYEMRISDWSSDVCSSDLFRGPALQQEGHGLTVLVPQPVGDTMGLDRLEALEEQQRLQEAAAGGIALVHRHEVGAPRIADVGVGIHG